MKILVISSNLIGDTILSTGVINGQAVGVGSTSEGLYFTTNGSDHSDYLLEESDDIKQVTGNVDHLISTLTTKVSAGSTEVHGLKNGDEIKLNTNNSIWSIE